MLIEAGISPTELKGPGKLRLASKKNKNKARHVESRRKRESKYRE